jgi:hypothetical protein
MKRLAIININTKEQLKYVLDKVDHIFFDSLENVINSMIIYKPICIYVEDNKYTGWDQMVNFNSNDDNYVDIKNFYNRKINKLKTNKLKWVNL